MSSVPLLGSVLRSRYVLQALLGAGGMGSVYLAYDRLRSREVALKLLHDRLDPDMPTRILRELSLQEKLRHPGVVRTYDGDHDEAHGLFFTMERIQGPSLEDLLSSQASSKKHPPFSLPAVFELLERIVSILEDTHREGVLHGDLKPSHLLFSKSDLPPKPKDGSTPWLPSEACEALLSAPLHLIDFGLAKPLTWSVLPTGGGGGTPSVMAPEQWKADAPLTPAADVYSLGLLVYRLLTGASHVAGQLPPASAWLEAHQFPFHAIQAFDPVLQKALSYFPSQRFPRPAAFFEAMQEARDRSTTKAPASLAPEMQAPLALTPSQAVQARPSDLPSDETSEVIERSEQTLSIADLERLASFRRLRTLDLSKTDLHDRHLVYLGIVETLQSLLLAENPIQGSGLAFLAPLRNLRSLSLSKTLLQGLSLAHLRAFPNLQWLSLWRCPIDDASLSFLTEIPALQTLYLSETPLTDASLPFLARMTGLRELHLHKTKISRKTIAVLQGTLTLCKIRASSPS